jgi:Flp pilus assembly protein TadD
MSQDTQEDVGQQLRENLFGGDLIQLPAPEEGLPDFLPAWFQGTLPALVYPPISQGDVEEGGSIQLEITPYHLYYGAMRELAETAEEERADALRRLVLEWNPQAAMEVCELARHHIEQDVETALLHYELAQELDEELYEAAQDGGMCEYAIAQAHVEEREERLESAEAQFRRAIELQPKAGLSWWSLARLQAEQGDPQAAEATLRRFLAEYPDGEQREMVEDALRHGIAAAEEPSADQEAFQQAQQLAFGEDPAAAVSLLQPLAETYPDSGEIWFILGVAHRRSGQPEEAERCLRRSARLVGTEPFIWLELARAYEAMDQWRPAENAVRKALELDPENPGYLCLLGRTLLAQGDREGAEEVIGQAREMVPDDPEVQEAVAALEKA